MPDVARPGRKRQSRIRPDSSAAAIAAIDRRLSHDRPVRRLANRCRQRVGSGHRQNARRRHRGCRLVGPRRGCARSLESPGTASQAGPATPPEPSTPWRSRKRVALREQRNAQVRRQRNDSSVNPARPLPFPRSQPAITTLSTPTSGHRANATTKLRAKPPSPTTQLRTRSPAGRCLRSGLIKSQPQTPSRQRRAAESGN